MNKRIGANGRKRNSGRRARKGQRRTLPLAAVALLAITIAGCIVINRYGHRLQSFAASFHGTKKAATHQVVLKGTDRVNADEALKRSGMASPVSLDQLKKTCLPALQAASPWIEKITIEGLRHDGKMVLNVRERKPVALMLTGRAGGIVLVDAAGVCLPLPLKTAYRLPLLSGLVDSTGSNGVRRLTAAGTARMNRFLRNLAEARGGVFAKSVTQVSFGHAPVLRALFEGSATVVVLDENDIAGCMDKYAGIRETLGTSSPEPVRIDLAYRNLAFVTPGQRPAGEADGNAARKPRG